MVSAILAHNGSCVCRHVSQGCMTVLRGPSGLRRDRRPWPGSAPASLTSSKSLRCAHSFIEFVGPFCCLAQRLPCPDRFLSAANCGSSWAARRTPKTSCPTRPIWSIVRSAPCLAVTRALLSLACVCVCCGRGQCVSCPVLSRPCCGLLPARRGFRGPEGSSCTDPRRSLVGATGEDSLLRGPAILM